MLRSIRKRLEEKNLGKEFGYSLSFFCGSTHRFLPSTCSIGILTCGLTICLIQQKAVFELHRGRRKVTMDHQGSSTFLPQKKRLTILEEFSVLEPYKLL